MRVKFHVPAPDGKRLWIEKTGGHLPVWENIKKELVGFLSKIDKLEVAANTPGKYYVHDG